MQTASTKIIGETFQKISDMVTPTMGAKGRLAVIEQELDKPVLTDDGVTVARQALGMTGFERLPAVSMVEAAANTEKEAYDGTTLTILMTNEFYKTGMNWTKPKWMGGKGLHPQEAADLLEAKVSSVRNLLKQATREITIPLVSKLATITTKIPAIGDIVTEACEKAGSEMNVVIEHDMKLKDTTIEHTSGLVLNSGYMSDVMRTFCNEGSKTVFEDAALVLLSEGLMTQTMLLNFFKSLPEEIPPLVFIITPQFNPESLKLLLDTLVPNQNKGLKFQFIFLNEEKSDELYLDIAAYTNGQIQDAALGTSNYVMGNCGTASKIIIEREKATIISNGDVSERIQSYEEMLSEHKFELSVNTEASIRRRLSNLKTGLVKIKLACPTVTEYMTIRLKLDDAIGAVRKAFEFGVLPGAGKALAQIAKEVPELKDALTAPMKTIMRNAGYEKEFKKVVNAPDCSVMDVKSHLIGDAIDLGIIDGFSSIDTAVKNAASIAASYIRSFILIRRSKTSN